MNMEKSQASRQTEVEQELNLTLMPASNHPFILRVVFGEKRVTVSLDRLQMDRFLQLLVHAVNEYDGGKWQGGANA